MTHELEARLERLRPNPFVPETARARVRSAALENGRGSHSARPVPEAWPRRIGVSWLPRRRRVAILLACVAAALAAAGALVRDSDSSEGLSRISTAGEPVEWQSAYQQARVPRLLADRTGRAFYTVPGDDGVLCFGVGVLQDGRLRPGSLTCPLHRGIFPSPDEPILFHARREASKGAPEVALLDIRGFAADGVERVELRLPNRTVVGPVERNTFVLDVGEPEFSAGTLVAIDPNGQVVYRYGLGERGASNLG